MAIAGSSFRKSNVSAHAVPDRDISTARYDIVDSLITPLLFQASVLLFDALRQPLHL